MSSAEIMDRILRKTQLECIIPRVLNSRQLRTSLSLSGGLQGRREFIQGPYGMKVRNQMSVPGEADLTCVCVVGCHPQTSTLGQFVLTGLEKQLKIQESWVNSLRSGSIWKASHGPQPLHICLWVCIHILRP